MNERELLVDCLRRLNRAGIAYFLTGSMASNYWGVPRTTHDIDFVVHLPPSAIPRLVEEFRDDFYLEEDAVRGVYEPPHQFNAIDSRSAMKVDFWLSKDEAFERETLRRRVKVKLFDEETWVASAEDVMLHKLAWSRNAPSERQLGDAAGIAAVQGETLDRAYLEEWSRRLGVSEQMRRLLSGDIKPKSS